MNREIRMDEALDIWADHAPEPEGHIPADRMARYAEPGGLKEAPPYDIRHLSLCPSCLDEFTLLAGTDEEEEDPETEDSGVTLDYGLLKAASTAMTRPVELTSGSRRFTLGIYPDKAEPGHALLLFRTREQGFDGASVSVRDACGRPVMKAVIHGGKASQTTDCLDSLDLSAWSVVVDKNIETGENS